jgi:ribosomal protein S26
MKNECQHKFNREHPNFLQCERCDKTVPVILMQRMSAEKFSELFPSLQVPVGPIIINDE